jgi:hypothetical protein
MPHLCAAVGVAGQLQHLSVVAAIIASDNTIIDFDALKVKLGPALRASYEHPETKTALAARGIDLIFDALCVGWSAAKQAPDAFLAGKFFQSY